MVRKMAKVAKALSALEIRNLKSPKKTEFAVGEVTGLYIQVLPSGHKSWILRKVIGGKRRKMGLGSYPDVTLKEAYELARARRSDIQDGIDPIADKKAKKASLAVAKSKEVTFKQLASDYRIKKASDWKDAKQVQRLETHLDTYIFPFIGNLIVRDILRDHIIQLLNPIWATKNPTATRVRRTLDEIFGMAVSRKLRSDIPSAWKGNLEFELTAPKKIHKVKHQDALDWRLAPKFMEKLSALDQPNAPRPDAQCLAFIILTVSRPTEARLAHWSEINLKDKIWTIPPSKEATDEGIVDHEGRKSEVEWKIPLTDSAIEILKSMPSRTGLIFNSVAGRKMYDAALSKLPKTLGYKATAHGFRTTFRTWGQEQQRFTEEALELCLKHLETDSTRAAYARSQLVEERRKILEAYEHWLFSGDKDTKVIPMTKRRNGV